MAMGTGAQLEEDDGQELLTFRGRSRAANCVKANLFLILNLLGVVVGFILGLAIRQTHPSDDALLVIGLPGELFLRILKAVVVPLIVCSVVVGTATTDPRSNGRIGLLTFAYMIGTNVLGGILGLSVYFLVNPGADPNSVNEKTSSTNNLQTLDIFVDFIRNLFPDNVLGATLQQTQTKYTPEETVSELNVSGILTNVTTEHLTRGIGVVGTTNLVGLIVLSAAFGISAAHVGEAAKPFIGFFQSSNVVIFHLFGFLKWTTPVGMAGLITRNIAGLEDLSSAINMMSIFMAANCLGLLAYQFAIVPLMYFVFTRKNPFSFIFHSMKSYLVAFGSTSSAVTMPEMFSVCDEVFHIDARVQGLVIPTGATINRDGSAFFIALTCLFVASYMEMVRGREVTIVILSILSALAVPAVPSSSLVTALVVLGSVGVPPANVGLILAVEFINDRMRTSANVLSTLCGCEIVWKFCQKQLAEADKEQELEGVQLTGVDAENKPADHNKTNSTL